jgi:multisubunit Na+/H+ antiporter MnhF subunit
MPSVHDYQKYNNIFNMSSFTSFASIIAIFVYIMVMLATIKLILSHKVKANTIEMIAYFLDFICLVFFFGYHYYDVIVNQLIHSKNVSKISGGCIELACTFLVIMFFVVWYRFYYRKKLQTRIITNPQLQKQLDNEFHLI